MTQHLGIGQILWTDKGLTFVKKKRNENLSPDKCICS